MYFRSGAAVAAAVFTGAAAMVHRAFKKLSLAAVACVPFGVVRLVLHWQLCVIRQRPFASWYRHHGGKEFEGDNQVTLSIYLSTLIYTCVALSAARAT